MNDQERIVALEAELAQTKQQLAQANGTNNLPDAGRGFTYVAKKSDNPKAPQRWGLITTPDGVTYRLSIWQRVSGSGQLTESIELEPYDRAQANADKVAEITAQTLASLQAQVEPATAATGTDAASPAPSQDDDWDDDIPF